MLQFLKVMLQHRGQDVELEEAEVEGVAEEFRSQDQALFLILLLEL
jgi:hypothetical protein